MLHHAFSTLDLSRRTSVIPVLFPVSAKPSRTESTLDQAVDTPHAPLNTLEKAQSQKAQSPAHSPSPRNVHT